MPKCLYHKTKFKAKYFNQKFCLEDDECIRQHVEYAKKKGEIKRKKEVKELKEKIKTKSEHLNDLQKIFNEFIRLRDKDLPCISCGTKKEVKYDAGHFYSVGAYPNLRFNEDNVHKQCSNDCNKNKHGNIIEYRPRLIEKIGQERFDILESQKNVKLHLSIPEINELKVKYKQKIKEIS